VLSGITPIADLTDTGEDASFHKERLSAYSSKASGPAGLTDYFSLLSACLAALNPVLNRLRAREYDLSIFMVGGDMTQGRRAVIKSYDLAKPIRDHRIEINSKVEQDFVHHGKVQAAAIYTTNYDNLLNTCKFMTHYAPSIAILSQRPDFQFTPGLDKIYAVAGYGGETRPYHKPYWLALEALLGPLGDVIVKTHGAFDDKYRQISLLYDPHSAAGDVFADSTRVGS